MKKSDKPDPILILRGDQVVEIEMEMVNYPAPADRNAVQPPSSTNGHAKGSRPKRPKKTPKRGKSR